MKFFNFWRIPSARSPRREPPTTTGRVGGSQPPGALQGGDALDPHEHARPRDGFESQRRTYGPAVNPRPPKGRWASLFGWGGAKARGRAAGEPSSSPPPDGNLKSIGIAIANAKIGEVLLRESTGVSNNGLHEDDVVRIAKEAVKGFDRLPAAKQDSYLAYARQINTSVTPRDTLHGQEIVLHEPADGTLDAKLRRTGSANGAWFLSNGGKLGQGVEGSVNRGSMLRLTVEGGRPRIETEEVAIKTLWSPEAAFCNSKMSRMADAVRSPHIIKYHGTHLVEPRVDPKIPVIGGENKVVMELAPYGTAQLLAHRISQSSLPREQRAALLRTMLCHVLRGVKAMHDAGMAHNDIKALNVLLGRDGNMKLADFGCAKESKRLGVIGTSAFMSNPGRIFDHDKRRDMEWLRFFVDEMKPPILGYSLVKEDPENVHLLDIEQWLRARMPSSEPELKCDLGELLGHDYFKRQILSPEGMLKLLREGRIIGPEPDAPSLSASLSRLMEHRAVNSTSEAMGPSSASDPLFGPARVTFKNLDDLNVNRLNTLSAYSPTLGMLTVTLGSDYPGGIAVCHTKGAASVKVEGGDEPRLLISSPSERLFPELLLDGLAKARLERARSQIRRDAEGGKLEVLADLANPGGDKNVTRAAAVGKFAEAMMRADFERVSLLNDMKRELKSGLRERKSIVFDYLSGETAAYFGADPVPSWGKRMSDRAAVEGVSETAARAKWMADNSESFDRYAAEYDALRP